MSNDLRMLKSFHEAAHVVAGYLQGRRIDIVTSSGSPRTETGRTFSDISSCEDAEIEIVSLLAGSEAIQALEYRNVGGCPDERLAARLAVHVTSTTEEAVELFDKARARTRRLVRSERFQMLLTALAVELAAVPALSGARASEMLASWDPAPVATGIRGATLAEFASWHSSPWATAKLAAMTPRSHPPERV